MRTLTLKPYLAIILTLAWSIACAQAQFTFTHIGDGATGSLTPNADPGSFTLVGGGNDIWDIANNFDFAHGTVTGDFDIRVRVESLEPVARWTKAGLMAREALVQNSRMAFNRVTPPNVGTGNGGNGANDSRFAYQTGTTSAGQGQHEDGSGAPEYPYGWLRLVRAGNVITAYASGDGANWRVQGVQDTATWEGGALPAALEVGLAVSRHSSGDPLNLAWDLATCEFRDYGTPDSAAFITTQPATQTIEENRTATFRFTAVGGLDIHNIQWRKDGADIPGATGPSYTTPVQSVGDSGAAYSVAITHRVNSSTAVSADAILTVTPDTAPPTVVSASATPGIADGFNLRFSEPVNEADAENIANYSLSGGSISAAVLQADNQTVRISSSSLASPGAKLLTVSNVRDRAGTPNPVATTTLAVIYADGTLRYDEYRNIGGGLVTDLTSNARFPNSPDFTGYVTIAENPNGGGGQGDNYGGRLAGFVTAPVSGAYRFYIAADDGAVLYLGTDENPATKVSIATEPIWNGFRNYTTADRRAECAGAGGSEACENVSVLINLVAGNRYYIEGLWKEGSGGDHMSIAWQLPGAGVPGEGIPGQFLTPLNRTAITLAAAQPADQTISENQPLVVSINITAGTPTYYIQWYKNGSPIPGATGTSYRIDNAAIADGGTYHATVQNGLGVATSRSANINVIIDTVAPSLVSAQAPAGNGTQFDLVFTEPVNETDAEDLTKYALPGVTLNTATLQADNKTVRFTTSNLHTDGCKILTVGSIRDRAIPPNTFAGGMIGVVNARGTIRYHQFNAIGGVAVANLTSNPRFPNSPDRIVNATDFENPEEGGNNFNDYGAQMLGYVHPPVSGAYRFFIAADDGAALWLSSNEDPANKVLIASEPIWSVFRGYTGGGSGGGGRNCPGTPSTCNISPPINLQAGCKYFVEMIYKEGGGGDYGSVAWQLPGGAEPGNNSDPIQAAFISPFEVAASIPADQPADATVLEGRFVTFTVNFQASPPSLVEWYRDGVLIPGATGTSITLGPLLHPEDNGATFYVIVSNSLAKVTSRTATLTVLPDTEPPRVVQVAGSTTLDRITVTFDELLDATADDAFGFLVDNGIIVATSVRLADGKTVLLTLNPDTQLQLDTIYTVTVQGIGDISGNSMVDPVMVSFHSVVAGGCGGVLFEAFNTGGGNAVSDLVNHPTFPNNPDFRLTIPGLDSRLAYPTDVRENYGARMRGVYVPPISGNWVFHVAADDGVELWLNPAGIESTGRVKIFEQAGCCASFAASSSAPQPLIGGRPYYIELLYKEGGGGDYGQVAARQQGSADPLVPIGARDLGQFVEPGFSGDLAFSQNPTDQTVTENRVATFTATAVSSLGLPICYQWYRRDNGTDVAIPGATTASYSLTATLADHGAVFTVRASIVGLAINSAAATLNVLRDAAAPTLLSASPTDNLYDVLLRFDETLSQGSAEDEFNYTIAGLTVRLAVLQADGQSVKLSTSEQAQNTPYTVGVSNVTDIAAEPNPVAAQASFTSLVFTPGFLRLAVYNPGPGQTDWGANNALDTTLLASRNYPDNPDQVFYMPVGDTRSVFPDNAREMYGARASGVFIPQTSGNWLFYIASDDSSRLFLNTAGTDPAGKALVVEEPGCCGPWAAHVSGPQALTAGSQYFLEALLKEGTGGDYLKIAAGLEGTPAPGDNPSGQIPISDNAIKAGSIGTFIPFNGASGIISQQPVDTTACINPLVTQQTPVTLTVGVEVTPSGTQSHVQWQRWDGSQWVDTPARGTSYTLLPPLSDNGAKYRAALYVLGAPAAVYSSEITLSVFQMNTPPQFTVGSGDSAVEDGAPRSVAGFANVTSVHSVPRVPALAFSTTFDAAPAGIILRGVNNPGATQGAAVRNGRLELTTPVNSAYGSAVLTAPLATYESLEISWKSYIGDGANTGADGISLSISDNIPDDPGYGGEEGWPGSAVSVAVDTFENGGIDPWGDGGNNGGPEGGLELKARDAMLAFQQVPKDNPGDGNYLRKSVFVNVSLTVSASGLATYNYDGNVLAAQIPSYAGIRANRLMFWSRTGGANDNQWIDDLNIIGFAGDLSSNENGQTVAFVVTNDNNDLFDGELGQPKISANGTLTYATKPDACGSAVVTVVARDSGGTECSGDDTADAQTFTINVECVPDCPVATPQSITVFAGVAATITLSGTDPDGDSLTAAVASQPQQGTLTVENGVLKYTTPATHPGGSDSFTFTVSDGTCTSPAATVSITIIPNTCPVPVASVTPGECGVTFAAGGQLHSIAVQKDYVCVVLDGSGSTDADGDPITITWVIDGTNTVSGTVVTSCLDVGNHTVVMSASDGKCTREQTILISIITPSESAEQIITLVENTTVERKNKRPLLTSLKAAKAAFDRQGWKSGRSMLRVFQHKVQAQIARRNPAEAVMFIQAADNVIQTLECVIKLPRRDDDDGDDDEDRDRDDDDGPGNGSGQQSDDDDSGGGDDDGGSNGDDDDGGSNGDDDDGGSSGGNSDDD